MLRKFAPRDLRAPDDDGAGAGDTDADAGSQSPDAGGAAGTTTVVTSGISADQYAAAKAAADAAEAARRLAEDRAAELEGQAAKALATAKRSAKLAALPGLEKESYLALVPDVDFDDTGALTADSKSSLETFRADNPSLFKAAGGGNTPGPGGRGTAGMSAAERRQLANAGIHDPDAWEKNAPKSVVEGIHAQRRARKGAK